MNNNTKLYSISCAPQPNWPIVLNNNTDTKY